MGEPGEEGGGAAGLVRLHGEEHELVEFARAAQLPQRRPRRLGVAVAAAGGGVGGVRRRPALERQAVRAAEQAQGRCLVVPEVGDRRKGTGRRPALLDLDSQALEEERVPAAARHGLQAQDLGHVLAFGVEQVHAVTVPSQSTLIGSTWVSSAEACERLAVRPQTLYAYVSRGLLHPRKEGRRSRFAVAELDELAARGRRTARHGRLEVLIDTELTLLDPGGRLAYRGVDVASIAGAWSYERAAEWLWTGVDDGEPAPWPAVGAPQVPGQRPADRIRAAAAVLAATAGPDDRRHEDAAGVGRRAIPALVAALPLVGDESTGTRVAERLWPRLTAMAPTPERVRVLDVALLLLADHELAASTVAVRVAASTWAPPLDAVVAGMAVHSGVLHGGMSTAVERALRHGDPLPAGFGHAVYREDDPRSQVLLPLVRRATTTARWRPVERALAEGAHPNVDLAIAAMALAFDMVEGSGEAVFAVARVAGWLAHAAEEHGRPFRFRPTASYVGLTPVWPRTGSA